MAAAPTGPTASLPAWLALLRWDKPSGRLILLIPAGWSLWLLPTTPPQAALVGWIVLGGLAVSGAGCIANDLWDRRIDPLVERTRSRPLASGRISVAGAVALLGLCLLAALAVVLWGLPPNSRGLCLALALAALPPVLLYPSAKRWFGYPQAVLALCWGFAVRSPWAAASDNRAGGWPLADGRVGVPTAVVLLLLCLLAALLVVLALPAAGRPLCLALAVASLPPVLLYPSAKRWFPFPQLVLALCWGFAVLIPWAAASGSLAGGWSLALLWLGTLAWTFGFDTVYAMSDREDDRRLGVRSSALSLGAAAPRVVLACYGLCAAALAGSAVLRGWGGVAFWLPWAVAAAGMVAEARQLERPDPPRSLYARHFSRQVLLGALLLLALVLAASRS